MSTLFDRVFCYIAFKLMKKLTLSDKKMHCILRWVRHVDSMLLLLPGEGGMSQEEKAKMVLDDLADRLPEMFDMEDIRSRVDEVTPYVMVAIQVSRKALRPWPAIVNLYDWHVDHILLSSLNCTACSCWRCCYLSELLLKSQ